MPRWRASKYMIPWQPTPPPTSAPAGKSVERLCGQPLQKAGAARGHRHRRQRETRARRGRLAVRRERGQDPREDGCRPRSGRARRPTRPTPRRRGRACPAPATVLPRLVEDAAQLRLDERPLLLDDDDRVDGVGELRDRLRDQRVGHRQLQHPDPEPVEVVERHAQVGERLHDVEVGLARAHDAQRRARCRARRRDRARCAGRTPGRRAAGAPPRALPGSAPGADRSSPADGGARAGRRSRRRAVRGARAEPGRGRRCRARRPPT